MSADEILEVLARRYSPRLLKRSIDEHTIECRVQGITYIPVSRSYSEPYKAAHN
ncbi:MAG: hypothetical protein JO166_19580 [Deltaproteobacteria bacterium]|nr:hypothetical protein [Deltaproteobacteria bacterium]